MKSSRIRRLVAAILGYILYSGFFIYLVATDKAAASVVTSSQVTAYLVTNGLVQAGIGALAGFYGGYLRRRLADPANRQAAAARRRR